MRIAAVIFGLLAALSLGFVAVGYFLPGTWNAEQTREIQASPEHVYASVAGARGWAEWAPWPEAGESFEGPETGVGSARVWDDPELGSGRFEIVDALEPERVSYRVELEEGGFEVEGRLYLEPTNDATRIRWREEGDFGRNPILSYTARRMEEAQAEQMARALDSLAHVVEQERAAP